MGLNPEKLMEALLKLCIGLFLFTVLLGCLLQFLKQLGTGDALVLFLLFGLLSPVAYLIRKSESPQRSRPRNISGAERAPLLPRTSEEDE